MTTHRFLRHRSLGGALAGAAALLLVSLSPAAAQFPPPPGQSAAASQNSPFPPPPGQGAAASQNNPFPPPPSRQQQQSSSPFPAPGQASAAPGGFPASRGFDGVQQGGFAVRPGGFSQPPGGFAPPQGGMGPPEAGPSEAQRVCLTFPSLREDVENGATTIRSASERKASREEVCPLFKAFATKEAKLVKFLETNQKLCGVPSNVITQVRQNHAKTIQIRNNVCSAAPAGPAVPRLSDALGGPIIADDSNVKTGRGTFDTLTGNALQR